MKVRFGCCGAPRPVQGAGSGYANVVDVRGLAGFGDEEVQAPPPAESMSLWKWALVLVGAGVATHVVNNAIDGKRKR